MATKIYSVGICGDYDGTYIFKTVEGRKIKVSSFENGIATVEVIAGYEFTSFLNLIAGCFEEDSNFESKLIETFGCAPESTLQVIKFDFNEAAVLITKENEDRVRCTAEWRVQMRINSKKTLKKQRCIEAVKQQAALIDKTTELEFKDDEAKAKWKKFVANNSKDCYSLGTVKYACRWAKYMQYLIKKHNKPLSKIAKNASDVSDIEGITDFMYGCAVAMLSECWKYGGELRFWHNMEYRQKFADGVVNPALLTIG